MRSSLISFGFVLLFLNSGFSQSFKFGLRASYGLCSSSSEEQFLLTPDNKLEYKFSYTHHSSSKAFGLFFQKKIGFIFLQPEFLYRSTEIEYEMIDYLTRQYDPHKMTEEYHFLHMPLTAGMHFNNIRIGAGPVFNYLMDIKSPIEEINHINEKMSSWTYGFQAGLGYDYRNFAIDLKYEWAFAKVADHIYHTGEQRAFSQNPNLINFSIGFLF